MIWLWRLSRRLFGSFHDCPSPQSCETSCVEQICRPHHAGQCVQWIAGNRLLALTAAGMTLDKLTPIGGLQALHHVPLSHPWIAHATPAVAGFLLGGPPRHAKMRAHRGRVHCTIHSRHILVIDWLQWAVFIHHLVTSSLGASISPLPI